MRRSRTNLASCTNSHAYLGHRSNHDPAPRHCTCASPIPSKAQPDLHSPHLTWTLSHLCLPTLPLTYLCSPSRLNCLLVSAFTCLLSASLISAYFCAHMPYALICGCLHSSGLACIRPDFSGLIFHSFVLAWIRLGLPALIFTHRTFLDSL